MSARTRRPLVDDDDDDDDSLFGYVKNNPKRYLLPNAIQFGYHKDHHSKEMIVSEDGFHARKEDPEKLYGYGMVHSAVPLKGTAEFEVTLTEFGSRNWHGTFKLGIVLYQEGESLDNAKIPAHSSEGYDNCIWCAHKVHDRIERNIEMHYGDVQLDDLREGDRLGLQLTKDGILSFYVNDEYQGIALTDVYKEGKVVYALVDHYGKAVATRITKAVMRDDDEATLQDYCLDKIASVLMCKDDIEKLSIPEKLRERLKVYIYP